MKNLLQKEKHQIQSAFITQDKIIPDNYRFINFGLLFLVCICNSIPLQAFAGVSLIISDIYKESTLIVSINWISYFVLYMIMVLPANYIIDQKGLKIATMISETCMIIGLSLRCLINISMAYFLFGSLLCSFGFCLTISAANKLPSVWFLNREIFGVKSILIFALLCSDALGYVLSTYFITKDSTKTDVLKFLIIESAIIGIFQIANIIFFKGQPQNPQNYFSRKSVKNFQINISKLVSNTSYLMLFLAMTFIFIDLSVLFIAISQFERAYNIEQVRTGLNILLLFLSGLFGCLLNMSYYPNQYKWKSVVFIMVTLMSHCLLWLGFETIQQWLIDISLIGIGISMLPLITTIVDWSAQCSFPVGEGSSGGSMFFGGYTFGSIATLLFGFYIGHDDTPERSRVTVAMLLTFLMLSFLFMMLAGEKLKRKEYEQNHIVQQKVELIITSESVAQQFIV